jgi:hypothetical protein
MGAGKALRRTLRTLPKKNKAAKRPESDVTRRMKDKWVDLVEKYQDKKEKLIEIPIGPQRDKAKKELEILEKRKEELLETVTDLDNRDQMSPDQYKFWKDKKKKR